MKIFGNSFSTSISAFFMGALLIVPATAFASSDVYAADNNADYGGGDEEKVIEVELDKQVWNPDRGEWEDDVDKEEHLFSPNDLVTYRLRYRNAGNVDLENVEIIDQLPSYIDYINGPGSYNSETGVFTYTVGELEKDSGWHSITLDVRVSADLESEVCVENLSWIYVDDEEMDSDEAIICAVPEEKVLGVEELPVSGATATINMAGFAALLIVAGLILKTSQCLVVGAE